ncbi:MAG: glycosyltransferase family 4 protein [Candidatus Sericytochromatia bacterium]
MKSLRFRAPVYGSSGYANAAKEFILALDKLDRVRISLEPLEWVSGFDIRESRERWRALKRLESVSVDPAESLLLHWTIAPEFRGRQEYRLGLGHTIFETNSLPRSYVTGCNRMDAVMVPSPFHVDAFRNAGVTVPLQVIPEGVDTERFHPEGPVLSTIPKRFTFLWLAQLSYRKGFDLVLKAFLELFAHHDDVQLVMRSYLHNGSAQDLDQVAELVRLYREQELGGLKTGHVFLLENVPDVHLPSLYRSAQVLVAPFRGEGWGLPIIEALASELPVIATGWGGPLSYLNEDMAYLLDYRLMPIPDQIPSMFLGPLLEEARAEHHLLAEPDFQQLKYAMWDAYQNYFTHKAKATQARARLETGFRWEHAAHKFADWIETL